MRKDSSPAAKIAFGQLYATGVPGVPKNLKHVEVLFRAAGALGESEMGKSERLEYQLIEVSLLCLYLFLIL
jgi:hypothetical protein